MKYQSCLASLGLCVCLASCGSATIAGGSSAGGASGSADTSSRLPDGGNRGLLPGDIAPSNADAADSGSAPVIVWPPD